MDYRIQMRLSALPMLRFIDYCSAALPFVHRDRIAEHHVLLYLTKGEMAIFEEGVEYKMAPSDVLFLKAGAHHWGESIIPAGAEWYFIHFFLDSPQGDTPFKAEDTPPQSYYFSPTDYERSISLPKLLRVQNQERITHALEEMKLRFFSSDPLRHAAISAQLQSMLLTLYTNENPDTSMNRADNIVQELVSFLKSNINRSLSSTEIAEHMHMSYQYLCSIFKRKNKVGIITYHTNLRINEACRLLRETRLNISEISDSVGYSNPFYFSNVFKKMTGKSPRKYIADMADKNITYPAAGWDSFFGVKDDDTSKSTQK